MSVSQPGRRSAREEHEERSLDFVQRAIVSVLVGVVFGSFAAVLAAYLAIRGDQDLPSFSVTGLWIMTGVLGVATAAVILLVNRRRPYSPWIILGLLPMVISAPWILG
jgi:cation transporter-like permease